MDEPERWTKINEVKNCGLTQKNGQVESVYSERVKLLAEQLIAKLQTDADAALKRIKARRSGGSEF